MSCLFTEAELGPDTRIEHTIPRVLGGRFRSRDVSSDAFNNAASPFDDALAAPYLVMLSHLAPLMTAEHQPGGFPVEVPGTEGRYRMTAGGAVELHGIRIDRRDHDTHRPLGISAADPRQLEQVAQQLGWMADSWRRTDELVVGPDQEAELRVTALCTRMEIAALKAVLLTFDHLLRDAPLHRFTRTTELAEVRALVRGAITEGRFEQGLLQRVLLGISYEDRPSIDGLRAQIPAPITEFEHVLVATGNADVRTFDLVWLVAGIDPIRFRISTRWNGPDVTIVAGCGIQVGTRAFGPLVLRDRFVLGPRTDRCTIPLRPIDRARAAEIAEEIGGHRRAATQRAIHCVEARCDDHVRFYLTERTRMLRVAAGTVPRIRDGVSERLLSLYRDRVEVEAIEQRVDHAVRDLPEEVRAQTIAHLDSQAAHVAWPEWLGVYRRALERLVAEVGLPGVFYSKAIETTSMEPSELLRAR